MACQEKVQEAVLALDRPPHAVSCSIHGTQICTQLYALNLCI